MDLMNDTVDSTLNHILSRVRVAHDAGEEEKAAASQRRTAECAASNGVTSLAKMICEELGDGLAMEFAREVVRVTGWQPPRSVEE